MCLCFSVTSTNVCPTPCPVLWLTSWTFTSDHLWPRRPDPGAEGNTFLLSLLLAYEKRKRKKTADSNGCVCWWNCKGKMCPDSHSLTLQGESVAECAEFLITTLLTFPLFGTLSVVLFKGLQFAFWFNLKLCVRLPCQEKCVCTCFDVALNTGCYFWCCCVHSCTPNQPQLSNHTTLVFLCLTPDLLSISHIFQMCFNPEQTSLVKVYYTLCSFAAKQSMLKHTTHFSIF